MSKINLNTFAGGALAEQVSTELQRIIENIDDPNTSATGARKLTVTISFKPNLRRNGAAVQINATASLAKIIPVETTILIGRGNDGKVEAAEMYNGVHPDQIEMDLTEVEAPVDGKNVIDLRKINQEIKEATN